VLQYEIYKNFFGVLYLAFLLYAGSFLSFANGVAWWGDINDPLFLFL